MIQNQCLNMFIGITKKSFSKRSILRVHFCTLPKLLTTCLQAHLPSSGSSMSSISSFFVRISFSIRQVLKICTLLAISAGSMNFLTSSRQQLITVSLRYIYGMILKMSSGTKNIDKDSLRSFEMLIYILRLAKGSSQLGFLSSSKVGSTSPNSYPMFLRKSLIRYRCSAMCL